MKNWFPTTIDQSGNRGVPINPLYIGGAAVTVMRNSSGF
jgi:hypothetical protein